MCKRARVLVIGLTPQHPLVYLPAADVALNKLPTQIYDAGPEAAHQLHTLLAIQLVNSTNSLRGPRIACCLHHAYMLCEYEDAHHFDMRHHTK